MPAFWGANSQFYWQISVVLPVFSKFLSILAVAEPTIAQCVPDHIHSFSLLFAGLRVLFIILRHICAQCAEYLRIKRKYGVLHS